MKIENVLNVKWMNWAGVFLTSAIVAVRAFQPGSEAMSEWSFASWVLMTVPALLPWWIVAASAALWAVGMSLCLVLGVLFLVWDFAAERFGRLFGKNSV